MSPVKMHSFNPLFVNTSPCTEEGDEFSGQCGTSQDESSLHIEPFPGSIGVIFCPPLPPCWSSLNLEPADCNHLSGSFLEVLDICPNHIRVTEHNMLTCPACPGGQEDKASSGPHSTYAKQHRMKAKSKGFAARPPDSPRLASIHPVMWTNYLISLYFGFLLCKMAIMIDVPHRIIVKNSWVSL